jgi:hypothetical protein
VPWWVADRLRGEAQNIDHSVSRKVRRRNL